MSEIINEKYEKLCQEIYGMSLKEHLQLSKFFDKRAEYVAQKFIAMSRLLNKECEELKPQEEELLLSKIHAHILFKAQKLDEKRKGNNKFVGMRKKKCL